MNIKFVKWSLDFKVETPFQPVSTTCIRTYMCKLCTKDSTCLIYHNIYIYIYTVYVIITTVPSDLSV